MASATKEDVRNAVFRKICGSFAEVCGCTVTPEDLRIDAFIEYGKGGRKEGWFFVCPEDPGNLKIRSCTEMFMSALNKRPECKPLNKLSDISATECTNLDDLLKSINALQ